MKTYILFAAKLLSAVLLLWWTAFVLLSHGFTLVSLIEGIVPIMVLVTAFVAWRWNFAGGLIFVLLGVLYIVLSRGCRPLEVCLFVAGPPILTGLLFILAGALRRHN
jgi:hypothetical protein